MGWELRWVRYGRPAASALRDAVRAAKSGDPLAPVTVVVPSNHVGVAARRLLASGALGATSDRGTGLAAVTFVTPYRLAELLGAPSLAEAGRRPVSTPVIAAALRAALATGAGVFGPIAAHPATETALVDAYRELRDVSEDALDRLAATSHRARDLVRLARATRARLAPGWYDEQDLTVAAVAALDRRAVEALGAVVVHLPQRVSRHSGALVAAIAERAGATVIAGTTGDLRADADVLTSLGRLGAPAGPPPEVPLSSLVAAGSTRIVTASDADDEVRAAVRAVVDATRAGTPLDRIAVLYASPEPYGRLVHEQLAAAGIPANGAAVVPLTERVAGRTLLRLLALGQDGFRREDVFAWLAAAPLLHEGRWAPVAAWERASRKAGVVRGRRDWDVRLTALADELEADAAAAERDAEEPVWRAERNREDAQRARSLRAFVLDLADDLAAAAEGPRRWDVHAGWARRHLDRLLGDAAERERWPVAERKAAERVERALDRLAALAEVEGPVALDVFARTLELELESDLGRVGRLGEGVLVGTASMGVGLDLDLVVVLGLAEGTFPSRVRDDSLLPDHEREAAGGELPLRRDGLERQHHELLAALAGASRHLLGVPRGDLRRSSERVPSRWVLDVASVLQGERWFTEGLLTADVPWVEHVASFDAGIRRVPFPATAQEHRLRSLLVATGGRRLTPDRAGDPVLAAGAEAVLGRRSDRFTRFDGNLSGLPVPSPATSVTSATRLEKWTACPLAYLLENVLRVEVVENPEEELSITPMDRGSLVHEALERFLVEVLARPADQQPGWADRWSAADHARLREIAEERCDDYEARGRTGRPIFWKRERLRILAELDRVLELDDAQRQALRSRPFAAELPFGFAEDAVDAVPLLLPDGRVVRFRGKADRVDVDEDGGIHVVDYKTGRSESYRSLSEDNPDLDGTKLQLPVYATAARLHQSRPDAPVHAEYWFISARGRFERHGYPVTDAVLERFGHRLAAIVDGIEAGVFPAHPTATSTSLWVDCHYCDPDALGVSDLRRSWERKRSDPAMAIYAELVEPVLEEAAADG
jgi:RecB family exonuclease